MNYERSCGAVVYIRSNEGLRYVLVQQSEGYHSFPKGHMEAGETEIETAQREVWEEIGVRPQFIEGFRAVDEHLLPAKKDTVKQAVYFLAESDGTGITYQEGELLGVKILSYEEALATLEFPGRRNVLRQAHAFITEILYKNSL